METELLAVALEREHIEIDDALTAFAAGPVTKERDLEPLSGAIRALRRHIYLEEEFLFPPLRETGLMAPVLVMLRDHAQIWSTLDSLERDLAAGSTGTAMLARCDALTAQLQHHNLKEERILYPRADEVLTASASARLSAFLAAGELPDGWVCERARI